MNHDYDRTDPDAVRAAGEEAERLGKLDLAHRLFREAESLAAEAMA